MNIVLFFAPLLVGALTPLDEFAANVEFRVTTLGNWNRQVRLVLMLKMSDINIEDTMTLSNTNLNLFLIKKWNLIQNGKYAGIFLIPLVIPNLVVLTVYYSYVQV